MITAISFMRSPGPVGQLMDVGDFSFTLSTTPRQVNGLSSDLPSNPGSNAQTVGTFYIYPNSTPEQYYPDPFVFQFNKPFLYDPSAGNLLLDVRTDDARSIAISSRYNYYSFTSDNTGLVSSSIFTSNNMIYPYLGNTTLVTAFTFDALSTPEPAYTWAILFIALSASAWRLTRKLLPLNRTRRY